MICKSLLVISVSEGDIYGYTQHTLTGIRCTPGKFTFLFLKISLLPQNWKPIFVCHKKTHHFRFFFGTKKVQLRGWWKLMYATCKSRWRPRNSQNRLGLSWPIQKFFTKIGSGETRNWKFFTTDVLCKFQASLPNLHNLRDTWRSRIHPWWSRHRRSNLAIEKPLFRQPDEIRCVVLGKTQWENNGK